MVEKILNEQWHEYVKEQIAKGNIKYNTLGWIIGVAAVILKMAGFNKAYERIRDRMKKKPERYVDVKKAVCELRRQYEVQKEISRD